MFNKKEIMRWNKAYDSSKYPISIYEELVVNQKNHKRKLELLGAWKTGCLRLSELGKEYTDKNGLSFTFTNRWCESAPVGYKIWIDISKKYCEIKDKIPKCFPEEQPQIVRDLELRKGFGFIWAIFVLHCFYPEIYPLYDQHVYRAYHEKVYRDNKMINQAPNTWFAYTKYREFFIELLAKTKLPYWEIDRVLWSYGKKVKQNYKVMNVKGREERNVVENNNFDDDNFDEKWIHDQTLGGKAKSFWWRMDEIFNILIKRTFIIKNRTVIAKKFITESELNLIHNYVTNDKWTDLANNVEKLKKKSEKEGLGKFLHEELNWSPGDAQLASHIGVIFYRIEIWQYNGKKRGIQFKRQNGDWKNRMHKYYTLKRNDV